MKTASWQDQLSTIKHVMQAAREEMNQPRPKRGRRHRSKIEPERKSAPDAGKRERDYEDAERRAREEQAEVVRNPYGSTFYPAD